MVDDNRPKYGDVKNGFPEYTPKNLAKVNSMRRAKSQPDFHGIPILHAGNANYATSSEIGGHPASCATCALKNFENNTCMLLGPSIKVTKFVKSGIEYWPRCSEFVYGEPRKGIPFHLAHSSPDTLGLVWINAPATGQDYGGSNCGGCDGGDDCDNYMVKSGSKWDNETGFCRVLRMTVGCGDYCAAWWDDDILEWQEAQNQIKGGASSDKAQFARSIIRRED
jgi:hypothetical protein